MKTLFCGCRLPLSGGDAFAVEGERIVPAQAPYGRVRRMKGEYVLPAFPDAHSHILAYALSLLQAQGSGLDNAQAFLAAAEAFAREHRLEEDALVTFGNVEHFPPPETLDVLPRPLHLQARSGHAGMFNAAARWLLGDVKKGVLEEGEYLAAARRVPLPRGAALTQAFRRAQHDYLAHGMTVAQEGYLTPEMFPLYRQLLHEGALLSDVAAYPSPAHFDEARALFADADRLRIAGVKIFLDGSPQHKTALLRTPYRGGGRGEAAMTEEETEKACRFAAARGVQLLAHCNGDGAAQLLLAALSRLTDAERAAVRPVLVHGQILGDDQLARCAALGVIPSFFPAHIRCFGDVHRANLGEERAARLSPARSALLRGIPFTLHQDTPVFAPDPLEAAACAVLRRTPSGRTFPAQAIRPMDALRALTEHAAVQYGSADMGRLEIGCRADFVVLEGNPFEDIGGTRVRETWLRGRCVYEA